MQTCIRKLTRQLHTHKFLGILHYAWLVTRWHKFCEVGLAHCKWKCKSLHHADDNRQLT